MNNIIIIFLIIKKQNEPQTERVKFDNLNINYTLSQLQTPTESSIYHWQLLLWPLQSSLSGWVTCDTLWSYPWQNPTHCHFATSLAVSLITSLKKARYVSSLLSVTTCRNTQPQGKYCTLYMYMIYMYEEWKHLARLRSLVVQIKSTRDLKRCSTIAESYETSRALRVRRAFKMWKNWMGVLF